MPLTNAEKQKILGLFKVYMPRIDSTYLFIHIEYQINNMSYVRINFFVIYLDQINSH